MPMISKIVDPGTKYPAPIIVSKKAAKKAIHPA
jgi:hypothetical protein